MVTRDVTPNSTRHSPENAKTEEGPKHGLELGGGRVILSECGGRPRGVPRSHDVVRERCGSSGMGRIKATFR